MPENDPTQHDPFRRSFDVAYDIAVGPDRAWFAFHAPTLEGAPDWTAHIWTLQRIEKPPRQPGVSRQAPSGVAIYRAFTTDNPEDYTEGPRDTRWYAASGLEPAYFERYGDMSPLTVPRLCSVYARRATDANQFNYAVRRFALWAAEQQPRLNQDIVSAAQIVTRYSFRTIPFEDETAAAAFADSFRLPDGLRPYLELNTRIAGALGQIIRYRGNEPGVRSGVALHLRNLSGSEITAGVKAYDEAGVLPDTFWRDATIISPGAVLVPELLPLLCAKLSDEHNLGPIKAFKPNRVTQTVCDYIGELLRTYAADPARHQHNVERIRKHVQAQGRITGSVSLSNLVDLSNSLIEHANRQKSAAGAPSEELLAPLKPGDRLSVSDALLRVLQLTRPGGNNPHAVEQFEQDSRHAEVIALIHEGGARYARVRALSALVMEYPGLTGDRLAQARSLIEHGLPFSAAIALITED